MVTDEKLYNVCTDREESETVGESEEIVSAGDMTLDDEPSTGKETIDGPTASRLTLWERYKKSLREHPVETVVGTVIVGLCAAMGVKSALENFKEQIGLTEITTNSSDLHTDSSEYSVQEAVVKEDSVVVDNTADTISISHVPGYPRRLPAGQHASPIKIAEADARCEPLKEGYTYVNDFDRPVTKHNKE